jgi:hypothetical protein
VWQLIGSQTTGCCVSSKLLHCITNGDAVDASAAKGATDWALSDLTGTVTSDIQPHSACHTKLSPVPIIWASSRQRVIDTVDGHRVRFLVW